MRPCFSDPQTQLLLALPLLMPEDDDVSTWNSRRLREDFFCVEQYNRKLAHLVLSFSDVLLRLLRQTTKRRRKNVEEAFQLCYIAFREHNLKHAGHSLLYPLGS